MGIPFEGTAESMEDTDKARDKIFRFVQGEKELFYDIRNSLKETVKQVTVFQKKMAKGFVDGEDKMPVSALNQFEGHGSRPVVGIFSATGRAKFGMAAERNKLESTAMGAAIHGSAIRRVTAVDHFFNVFHDNRSGLQVVFNNFIIVF